MFKKNRLSAGILFFLLGFILVFSLGGCIQIKTNIDGGIYKSFDRADSWKKAIAVPTIDQTIKTIGNVQATTLIFDPQDSQTLYLGTKQNGLFYTYNGGNYWQSVSNLPAGLIRAVSVDPKDKAKVYVAIGNSIYTSNDCCRGWKKIDFDSQPSSTITSLMIDNYNPAQIYAAFSDGRLLLSTNYGQSWSMLHAFDKTIKQLLINPHDTRLIYVFTSTKLYKSSDMGQSWDDLTAGLESYGKLKGFSQAIFSLAQPDALVLINQYGLIKSSDGGKTWENYQLVSQPNQITIYSVAVNPHNSNEIYYATNRAIYRTRDGGIHWVSKSLPTSQAPVFFLVDPDNTNQLYLGVIKVKAPSSGYF